MTRSALRLDLDEPRRVGGPNDITRGQGGNFYIAEQDDEGKPAYVCVRDGIPPNRSRPAVDDASLIRPAPLLKR
jgi:hypothetical protein